MKKIANMELYIGTKEEYNDAMRENMKIVCALNRAEGYVTHQSLVGWSGRGCNKDNPYYLFYEKSNIIALNLIDGDDHKFVSSKLIDSALHFIDKNLKNEEKVFIYCSLGQSRSPSIALIYLMEQGIVEKSAEGIKHFKTNIYPDYKPGKGMKDYIINNYII